MPQTTSQPASGVPLEGDQGLLGRPDSFEGHASHEAADPGQLGHPGLHGLGLRPSAPPVRHRVPVDPAPGPDFVPELVGDALEHDGPPAPKGNLPSFDEPVPGTRRPAAASRP